MKIEKPICPKCGGSATGVIEDLTGVAQLDVIKINGVTDYAGETKVLWDEQTTRKNEDGEAWLICANDHQWTSKITEDENQEK